MGKGRKGRVGRRQSNASAFANAEVAMIERIERDVQRRTARRQQLPENTTTRKRTLIITGNDDTKVVYTKADKLSTFSVKELLQSIGVEGIDMSSDVNPGVEKEKMALRFAENVDKDDAQFRIYMRDSINYVNFAVLQHLVESMYLPRQLEELQGWIMHVGSIFVMGGVDFDLVHSVDGCKEAFAANL